MLRNNRVGPQTASRGDSLETVLMRKAAEHRLRDDAVTVRNAMPLPHRNGSSAGGKTGPEARVRTPAIVMRHPLPKDGAEVIFV